MNILLTSAGRRNYMVSFFKDALKQTGGKVFVMNSSLDSPAIWLADDFIQAPLIYSEEYEPFLLDYCLRKNVGAVISLFDIELPVLSRLKEKFLQKGIVVIVADEWVTEMSNDKFKTFEFLTQNGFPVVRTYINLDDAQSDISLGKLEFPLYLKPRWGMGSIGIYKATSVEELIFYYNACLREIKNSYLKYESGKDLEHAVIIQAALAGQEYGLDIINDLDGNFCNTVVKRKLAMRSGETDIAITVSEPQLYELGKHLSGITRHPANMDVDVFFDGSSPHILEINPRFGGGYPFSHAAGVDLPKAIINWLSKSQFKASDYLTARVGVKAFKGITIVTEKDH